MQVYAIQVEDSDSLDLKAIVLTEDMAQERFAEIASSYGYSLKTATRYMRIEIWDASTGDYIDDLKVVIPEGQ